MTNSSMSKENQFLYYLSYIDNFPINVKTLMRCMKPVFFSPANIYFHSPPINFESIFMDQWYYKFVIL